MSVCDSVCLRERGRVCVYPGVFCVCVLEVHGLESVSLMISAASVCTLCVCVILYTLCVCVCVHCVCLRILCVCVCVCVSVDVPATTERQELAVFRSYHPGDPSPKLYIKNLARSVTEEVCVTSSSNVHLHYFIPGTSAFHILLY